MNVDALRASLATATAELQAAREALQRIVSNPCAEDYCACCEQDRAWAIEALARGAQRG